MKMIKGIKKIICMAIALVTLLAFSGVALATIYQSEAEFSNGTCYNQFTTRRSLSKSSGNWDSFLIMVDDISFSSSGYELKLCWTPKYSSSVTLHDEAIYRLKPSSDFEDCTRNSSYNPIHYLIRNPYGPNGPNMMTEGGWMCGNWAS